ncbi:MAG: FKBP-type peptidyl-prolyl cis-trans isomerase [Desulfobacteraceae bacterium]|nr:FKBP-type peptidyl-prolyl cis-trans isomerase [Desulfobacteraceae bacterium]
MVNAIVQGDRIDSLAILRIGEPAKAFQSDQAAFDSLLAGHRERQKAQERAASEDQRTIIEQHWPQASTTPSGLKYVTTQEGTGEATPKPGDTLTVHYTGTLLDGVKFDSSRDRGTPFRFPVGRGRVIRGWDEAFLGMRRGEQRTLIIPPDLAYGAGGAGGVIPPNATLVFEVELIDF